MIADLDASEMLDRIHRGFLAQGWDDHDDAAGSIVAAIRRTQSKTLAAVDLPEAVPPDFMERNGIDLDRLGRFLMQTIGDFRLLVRRVTDTLIYPENIDTFSRVAEVSLEEITSIPLPLRLHERDVKRLLLDIVGEKETDNDWGGELSDAFTTHVVLDGVRIASSFVLKGPSEKGVLTPRRYGTNGDQITRAFKQRASLFVVQANARLADSINDLVDGLVHRARAQGDDRAVATLWDGADTARILVAYGKIDRTTGEPI